MKRKNWHEKAIHSGLCLAALLALGCGNGKGTSGDADVDAAPDPDAAEDISPDPDASQDPDAADVPQEEVPEDVAVDDVEDIEAEPPPPPDCAAPPAPAIGSECQLSTECGGAYPSCFAEKSQNFEGEDYVFAPGGFCMMQGVGDSVCDYYDPYATCPEGTNCVLIGWWMNKPINACLDSCTAAIPGTDPPELYDFNCGCREGYSCDMTHSLCQPGCSNDRECCEIWNDDGDYRREDGEVIRVPGCTNTCDNDPSDDGAASYMCINAGTPGAEFGDPCEHDSQCPADSMCDRAYQSGYCYKDRCDAVGRGCADGGGYCVHGGTLEYPKWQCLRACNVGQDPDAAEFPCRREAADEKMTCVPIFWEPAFLDTTDYDGYCYFGNFNDVTEHNYFTDCSSDEACYSPLGLGICVPLRGYDFPENFCTIQCTEGLAVNQAICGPNAEGVCFDHPSLEEWDLCMPACDIPGGDIGANGCPVTDPPQWACYPTSDWEGRIFVASEADMPTGFCYPLCVDDAFCLELFRTALTCDVVSGICHS